MSDSQITPFSQVIQLDPTGENTFTSRPVDEGGDRMFGGLLLGLSLKAAQLTVADGKQVHSLHGYFMRPGATNEPVDISVERVRDGRAFGVRAVSAAQNGKELFRMLASVQTPESGLDYQGVTMPEVGSPDEFTYTYAEFCVATGANANAAATRRPVDIRYVNPPSVVPEGPVTEAQKMWMRITDPLPADPETHAVALAYLADTTLIDHALLPHAERWEDPRVEGASLDHAMWFHRPTRADEWLLFEQTVEFTGGARGLAHGRFFDRRGHLVASCNQEGLVRLND